MLRKTEGKKRRIWHRVRWFDTITTSMDMNLSKSMDYSTQVFPVLYCVLDLLKFMSIEVVMPSSHLILWHPLLLLPLVFLSIRVFSSELAFHIRWPKYWSLSIVPSNKYLGLISFRIDWFGLHAPGLVTRG